MLLFFVDAIWLISNSIECLSVFNFVRVCSACCLSILDFISVCSFINFVLKESFAKYFVYVVGFCFCIRVISLKLVSNCTYKSDIMVFFAFTLSSIFCIFSFSVASFFCNVSNCFELLLFVSCFCFCNVKLFISSSIFLISSIRALMY